MLTRLPQPLWVAALSLPLIFVLLDASLNQLVHLLQWVFVIGSGLLLGFMAWGWQRSPVPQAPITASTEIVHKTLTATETLLQQLETEADPAQIPSSALRSKAAQIATELEREDLRFVLMGETSVGKTTLLTQLQAASADQFSRPCTWQEQPEYRRPGLIDADLILFVVQGDLTEPEYQCLTKLKSLRQRTLLVWNKQDQYLPTERPVILQQLQRRLQGILAAEDIIAIAAHPQPIQVRRHQPDGSIQTWQEQPQPDVQPLIERLQQITGQEAAALVTQQTWRQAVVLKTEVTQLLYQSRRDRALPIIEKFQWIAAAAAFANPVPTLDVLAMAAVFGQMILELGQLYHLKFTFAQAQAIAKTLASLMLKFGLVEFSSQTFITLLKGNTLTYVAGGAIQGVSAAYLTRMAGLSLVEHFQQLDPHEAALPNRQRLGLIVQQVFQNNQRPEFFKLLLHQARTHLQFPEFAASEQSKEANLLPSSSVEAPQIAS
jgi:uncharacterized protein